MHSRGGGAQHDRVVAIGIAGSRRVDTLALRECDRWDALLDRTDFRVARRSVFALAIQHSFRQAETVPKSAPDRPLSAWV
jgi:hypothetical protein